jgi:nitroimidazol reductase NimA-like FMN-containing flavoprotein (pyridoxamine 5'-phosphate oxidase superfamily)
MGKAELDAFLAEQRTCRVATTGPDGPHLTALFFFWDGTSIWLTSVTRSKRWAQLTRDPRVAVLVDDGHDYAELRGVELRGKVEIVGEVPRTGLANPELAEPERLFARKYWAIEEFPHDGRHAWLRMTPHTIVSWDFRKLRPGP